MLFKQLSMMESNGELNYPNSFFKVFALMAEDSRIGSGHIAVFAAIYAVKYSDSDCRNITKWDIMKMAKISDRNTFYKIINALNEYKYLNYKPSSNQYIEAEYGLNTDSCVL